MCKQQPVKEVKVGDKILRIFTEDSPMSPREWDNMARFICFHKRYNLGDKHSYKHEDYSGWAEMKKAIEKKEKAVLIKPLYMYDHSGITISTELKYPFNDRWDAGMIGFVIVTREAIKENFGVKRITKDLIQRSEKNLDGEVEIYDQYLRNDVYRYELLKVEGEDEIEEDSCGGFFGTDWLNNGITEHAGKEFEEALKAA